MFTKWQQVEEWITDNGFKRWIFYNKDPEKRDADRANDKVLDSRFYPGTIEEKLSLTKKHLEQWGDKVWGQAYQTETATVGACVCVVRLDDAPAIQQPLVPQMPVSGDHIDVEQMKASIRKEIETEFARREYEREKKDFEKDKREFERAKASAIGLIIQQFAPYVEPISSFLKGKSMVAGIDAEQPTTVPPVQPLSAQQPATGDNDEDDEQSPFTDEEAEQLLALMTRFKAAEPEDYLELIEAVVTMAEAGDSTYKTAKMVLLSKKN